VVQQILSNGCGHDDVPPPRSSTCVPEVLALASYPPYDAADRQVPARSQDAATVVVDPGSIHWVITIGARCRRGR
jgi:hypothetical protein